MANRVIRNGLSVILDSKTTLHYSALRAHLGCTKVYGGCTCEPSSFRWETSVAEVGYHRAILGRELQVAGRDFSASK